MIDKRTIPDAAHIRRHGRIWLYGLQFSDTGLRQDSCGASDAAPSLAVLYSSSDEYRNVQGDNGAYYPSARITRIEIQVQFNSRNVPRRIPIVIRRASNDCYHQTCKRLRHEPKYGQIIHPHGCLVQGRKFSEKLLRRMQGSPFVNGSPRIFTASSSTVYSLAVSVKVQTSIAQCL